MEEVVKWLKALAFLQAVQMTGIQEGVKPELLLSRAGLSHQEIAALLGKNYAAVAQTISRAK